MAGGWTCPSIALHDKPQLYKMTTIHLYTVVYTGINTRIVVGMCMSFPTHTLTLYNQYIQKPHSDTSFMENMLRSIILVNYIELGEMLVRSA